MGAFRRGRDASDVHSWAFLANPRLYRIEDAVRDLDGEWWPTKGRSIAAGDRALIWKAKGDDPVRGIVALGEVRDGPTRMHGDSEYWIDPTFGRANEDRVFIRYVRPLGLPLWLDGRTDSILGDLSVSRARGGTVFNVKPEQWASVLEMAGGLPQDAPEVEDALAAVDDIAQGFRLSPKVRGAVQQHAMVRATNHWEALGWRVEDVSARKSYDLHCTRSDGEELRVEVKGTTGDGSAVLLTPNEVEHASANHPQVALVVVSGIEVAGTDDSPIAQGGVMRVWNPWDLRKGQLTAIGYSYKPPIAG